MVRSAPLVSFSCGLFALATITAAYLAWISLSGGAVAGCGPQSPCHHVLHSRWAYWFGLPVSVPAALMYLLLCGGTARWARTARRGAHLSFGWLVSLAFIVIAAAAWFAFLQAVVIRTLCLYCLAAHLAATAAAVLILIASRRHPRPVDGPTRYVVGMAIPAALVGLGLLIAGQLVVRKQTHQVSPVAAPQFESPSKSARIVSLYDGRFRLDLDLTPRLGAADAPHVMVALLDFTCSHCRHLHELIVKAQARFARQLVVITLPVPLDARCNPIVRQTAAENVDGCDYARLALAVWRVNPEALAAFSSFLFGPARPPRIALARRHAEEAVGVEALQAALRDPWIDDQLKTGIGLFEANSKRAGAWQLPQLMIEATLSVGAIESIDGLYLMLREQFGLVVTD
jgi:uncharacterized membrane protein